MRRFAQARNPYSPAVVMDSGFTLRAPRNDDLFYVNRSQKFFSLLARRKATKLTIVGIVLGRIR